MIIGKYAVQFDYEMGQGLVVKDPLYIETMITEFERIKKKALPFVLDGENQMNAYD